MSDFCFALDTHALPRADVCSDHRLMILRAAPGRYIRQQQDVTGPCRPPRLQVQSLRRSEINTAYTAEVARLHDQVEPSFSSLSSSLYQAGVQVLGTVSAQPHDWRDGHANSLRAAAARLQAALDAYSAAPDSAECLAELRSARNDARRQVRLLKHDWWTGRLTTLEAAARRHDARFVFSGSKEMGRLLRNQGVTTVSLAADPLADLEAKADHFHRVLNVDRPVADVWVINAVRRLATGKAPDVSGVHAELLQALCRDGSAEGTRLLDTFCSLIARCWQGEALDLTTWHQSLVRSIWKGKGEADLDNSRDVVLLDILSRVLSRLFTDRLATLAEGVCHPTECGYRKVTAAMVSFSFGEFSMIG
eukprot:s395_g23.t1